MAEFDVPEIDVELLLTQILSERYAKDVRQAIHDAIERCYLEGKVGSVDLYNRRRLDHLITHNNDTEGNSELIDIRLGEDGVEYDSAGEAVRQQVRYLSDAISGVRLDLDDKIDETKSDLEDELDATNDKIDDLREGADGTMYESAGEAIRAQITELADKIVAILADESKDFSSVEFDEETRLLHFYDELGADVYDPVSIAGGGGGGGGTVTTSVKLTNQNGTATLAFSAGKAAELKFTFTSTENDVPTGNGTCQITVNGIAKSTFDVTQGLTVVDVAKYLSAGSNTVRVKCTDMYGNYRVLVYTINVVDMYLASSFDATIPYSGDITFKYTPYGAIDKTVHILVDGDEIYTKDVSASGKQSTLVIPKKSHGVHILEAYLTAEMGGVPMESDHLIYDIVCVKEGDTTPMIASAYGVKEANQGELVTIPYIVYDPTKLTSDIILSIYTLKEDGSEDLFDSKAITVDRSQNYWSTRKYPVGTVYFKIAYGAISKIHTIEVSENDVNVEAETNDLELYLTSQGRSNTESGRAIWSYRTIKTDFTNVNWASNGWVPDENGDTCLRLSGDARAEIQFQPFSKDIRTEGKTLEIEFAIRDVNNRDAVAISCMSGGRGFEVKPDTAYLASAQARVFCNFKEEEKVRVSFVVESRNEHRLLGVYLNGILSDIVQYATTDDFQQSSPVNISIGSEFCCVDVYNIRSYDTALTSASVVNNFIADTADVAKKTVAHEQNDIYDYGKISFEKARQKNSVMVITGTLPKAQGDEKTVGISYYDAENQSINYVDDKVVIDIQGTSSKDYARKNWKLKFSTDRYIDAEHLPAKVICIKVDYAESTGTHNTQNANFVHTLYEEPTPAQLDDPKTRTTIYGKPILLFHQESADSDPVFYGKANYNYDKGAEYVFGFTNKYDVECWEFMANNKPSCSFLSTIPEDWSDCFEARYPKKNKDISRFKVMHDWVVSTKDNVEKFKAEFEQYFDLHYTLIYYVYTFFALMADQRAKNLFLTYWGSTGKWQPWFYDNDTCFGIDNEGELIFDYYHEDTDQVNGENVYGGQNSVLWTNFREAFADEIKATYQHLRNDGFITYEKLVDRFITEGSDKWSESIYNEDGEFKYVSMLKSDNDSGNLRRLRGSGEEHLRYFLKNRLNYCDSKWSAADYENDQAVLRISTPSEWSAVEPCADITVTAYSNVYAGLRYTANSRVQQKLAKKGVPTKFEADPDDVFNTTETTIFGASQISSFGDLAPLYCGSVNVSKAVKLTELKIGDETEGYNNNQLTDLSVGTNRLLKKLDIRNCSSLNISVDLTGCPNIEEVYANGTAVTAIEFAADGCLQKASLPATIVDLTLKNQQYIDWITFEGYGELKTICVENCPTFNTLAVLSNATNVERVRLTKVNWSYADASAILALAARTDIKGIDENGINTDKMWIDGTCHIGILTGAEMAAINAAFPYLTITYDSLTAQLVYMTWDGSEELHRETVSNGGNGTDPSASIPASAKTRESTAQYDYVYGGWSKTPDSAPESNALKVVSADRIVYAAFTPVIRSYEVKFYNGATLLQTVTVEYGKDAVYTGETPQKDVSNPEDFEFTGWSPAPTNIQGPTICYAQYYDTRVIEDDWATVDTKSDKIADQPYGVGSFKSLDITHEDGTIETIDVQVVAERHDELADGNLIGSMEYVAPMPSPNGSTISTLSPEYRGSLYSINTYYDSEDRVYVLAVYKLDGSEYTLCAEIRNVKTYITGKSIAYITEPVVHEDALYFTVVCDWGSDTYVYDGQFVFRFDGSQIEPVASLPDVGVNAVIPTKMVSYDGSLYIAGHFYASSGRESTIRACKYRRIDVVRKLVGDSMESDALCSGVDALNKGSAISCDLTVHNGELYLCHGSYLYDTAGNSGLFKWNGESWSRIADIPYPARDDFGIYLFSYKNKLVCYGAAVTITYVGGNVVHTHSGHTAEFVDGSWVCVNSLIPSIDDAFRCPTPYGDNVYFQCGGYMQAKHMCRLTLTNWRQHSIPPHAQFNSSCAVVYRGELHTLGGWDNPTGHSKYDGHEWTEVGELIHGGANASAVVYNDEIHLFGGSVNGTSHTKYDGTSWTEVGTSPVESPLAVVFNNGLYLFNGSYIYKFNDATSEWLTISTTGLGNVQDGPKRFSAAVIDGHIHFCGGYLNDKHYSWDGTSWYVHGALPYKSTKPALVNYDGKLHLIGGFHGSDTTATYRHHTYNGSGWDEVETMPYSVQNTDQAIVFQGHLHILTLYNDMLVHRNPSAGLTFIGKASLKDPRKMNDGYKTDGTNSSFNCGGWAESDLREWLNTELFSMLPADLQAAIKPVIKLSDGGYYDKTIVRTEDKIWIPSAEEVYSGYDSNVLIGQGETYPVFTDAASRQRSVPGASKVSMWWLRSTHADRVGDFHIVDDKGSLTSWPANDGAYCYVLFGFCI